MFLMFSFSEYCYFAALTAAMKNADKNSTSNQANDEFHKGFLCASFLHLKSSFTEHFSDPYFDYSIFPNSRAI